MVASISNMTAGAARYFAGGSYYFKPGGDPPGEWLGEGAKLLGLGGSVTEEHLTALMNGFHPVTKERLVQNAGHETRVPGVDMTFGSPKGVSAVYGAHPDQRVQITVEQCVRTAVRVTVKLAEENFLFTRRGKGGHRFEHASAVVAAFVHSVNRHLEPHLHVHALFLSVGVRADGTTGSINDRELYRAKMTLGAIFRTTLAAELERALGLTCLRTKDGSFRVEGVDPELCEHFSSRRREVKGTLAARGQDSPAAAAKAALDTREAKRNTPPREQLHKKWSEEARINGFTVEDVPRRDRTRDHASELKEAISEAVSRIAASKNGFPERDLIRFTAEAAQERGLDGFQVVAGVRKFLETSNVIELGTINGTRLYTIPAGMREERAEIAAATKLGKRHEQDARPRLVESDIHPGHNQKRLASATGTERDKRNAQREITPRAENSERPKEKARPPGSEVNDIPPRDRNVNEALELKKSIAEAVSRITESRSHFTERELTFYAIRAARERGLDGKQIPAAVREALETSDFIELGTFEGHSRYTTPTVMQEERAAIAAATKLGRRHNHENAPLTIGASILAQSLGNPSRRLSPDQAEVIRRITGKGANLRIVEGDAGTGKTTALNVARKIWELNGRRVVGFTLSGKAAKELREGAKIKSYTVAAFDLMTKRATFGETVAHSIRMLGRSAFHKPTSKLKPFTIDKNTVVVVDEAGMLDTRQLFRFVEAAKRGGGQLVLVGDRKQLQAIGRGGMFGYLADKLPTAKLTRIIRQEREEDREVVRGFARGDARAALESLAKRGLLSVESTREAAKQKLVTDWTKRERSDRSKALIIASTNDEVRDLNSLCQAKRTELGEIRTDKHVVANGYMFYEGDRVLFTERSKVLGVENGELGTILKVHPFLKVITVKVDGAKRPAVIPLRDYDSVALGYALTTHRVQGTTVDRAYLLVGGSMQDREMSYVQASRVRWAPRVYVDEHQAGKDLKGLSNQMRQSREKTMAHAVKEQTHERSHELTREEMQRRWEELQRRQEREHARTI